MNKSLTRFRTVFPPDRACSTLDVALLLLRVSQTQSDENSARHRTSALFIAYLVDEILESFQIQRSLSMKGCPYDNAVAESTFRMIKKEFVSSRRFSTLEQLRLELADYVHWFNNIRLHGTLGYLSPVEFRNACTL